MIPFVPVRLYKSHDMSKISLSTHIDNIIKRFYTHKLYVLYCF